MNWQLQNKIGTDELEQKKITLLLNAILQKFEQLIPEEPPLGYKPIVLECDRDLGYLVTWENKDDSYLLSVNGCEMDIEKIAFQFARGVGHLYSDPRVNNWLIEVFCHIASLYYIDFIVDIWETNGLDSFSGHPEDFISYKNLIVSDSFSGVDLVQYQVSNKWIKNEVNKLRRNQGIIDRDRIILVALELIPLFKLHEEAWQLLPFLGKSVIDDELKKPVGMVHVINSKPDFEKLEELLPETLTAVYQKIKRRILDE